MNHLDKGFSLANHTLSLGEDWEPRFLPSCPPDVNTAVMMRNFFDANSWMGRKKSDRQAKEFLTLARLNDQKTALLYTASHEVRGSLHGIFGLVERLRNDPSSNARTTLDALADACSGLQSTVQQVFDLAQLETGQGRPRCRVFDLRSVLREVSAVVSGTAGPDVVVRTSIDDSCSVSRLGDAGRLNQILTNIATNGVKAMHHGVLSIRVSELSEGIVRFVVRDEGDGMPAFARARLVRKTSGGTVMNAERRMRKVDRRVNSGLGLLIARELIESLDGQVDVSVERSAGTMVQIDLPLPLEESGPLRAVNEIDPVSSIGRALVVDDAPDGLQFLAHSLDAICEVCDATVDSEEALALAGRSNYDLVILDGMMSPHDGADLSRALRQLDTTRNSVIIVATGNVETVSSSRYLAAGADLVLVKPFSRIDLVRAVRRTITARTSSTSETLLDLPAVEDFDSAQWSPTVQISNAPSTGPLCLFDALLGDRLSAIHNAFEQCDDDAFRRATHALGSAAVVMGVDALGRYCLALETVARSAGLSGVGPAALDQLTVLADVQRSVRPSSTIS